MIILSLHGDQEGFLGERKRKERSWEGRKIIRIVLTTLLMYIHVQLKSNKNTALSFILFSHVLRVFSCFVLFFFLLLQPMFNN